MPGWECHPLVVPASYTWVTTETSRAESVTAKRSPATAAPVGTCWGTGRAQSPERTSITRRRAGPPTRRPWPRPATEGAPWARRRECPPASAVRPAVQPGAHHERGGRHQGSSSCSAVGDVFRALRRTGARKIHCRENFGCSTPKSGGSRTSLLLDPGHRRAQTADAERAEPEPRSVRCLAMYLPLEQWSPIPGDGRDTTENGSTCHDWGLRR